ncbi:sulfotransferase [Thioalkalivibrio paradoxus ARh 1]|uniref:Sulfotransferase n=2 Tax=Thioalkalivibrio paradoxus TaxID=108010 RepID=W0DKR4_9GAMM|nr:sulfotransferase [Thioalkalivibrio paradoxus ARh 1]
MGSGLGGISHGARPNLFIVGAQKSGTTTLANWLMLHPQAFMAFPKEPGYLAFGERGYRFPDGHGRTSPAREWVVTSHGKYLGLFQKARADQRIIGEASTWYLAVPGTAERICREFPDARIVVILRNPVERAYSAWCHARRDGLEPIEDFEQALDAEPARGESEFLLRYLHMGRYVRQLRPYLESFPRERLLVLLFDDLRRDPQAVWRRLCLFLDIDPELASIAGHARNRSGIPRVRLLQSLATSHRLKHHLLRMLPFDLLSQLRHWVEKRNLRPFPPLPVAAHERLRNEYRDEIVELGHLLGRDLDHWLMPSPQARDDISLPAPGSGSTDY